MISNLTESPKPAAAKEGWWRRQCCFFHHYRARWADRGNWWVCHYITADAVMHGWFAVREPTIEKARAFVVSNMPAGIDAICSLRRPRFHEIFFGLSSTSPAQPHD